jgi:hypothetical protein
MEAHGERKYSSYSFTASALERGGWSASRPDIVKYLIVIYYVYLYYEEPGSSVSVVSGYRLDDRAIEVRSPAEVKRFFL